MHLSSHLFNFFEQKMSVGSRNWHYCAPKNITKMLHLHLYCGYNFFFLSTILKGPFILFYFIHILLCAHFEKLSIQQVNASPDENSELALNNESKPLKPI